MLGPNPKAHGRHGVTKPEWHWSNQPNPEEILRRMAQTKMGKPTWNKGLRGIGGYKYPNNRISPKCGPECECGKHTARNSGQFKGNPLVTEYPQNWRRVSRALISNQSECQDCGAESQVVHHKDADPTNNALENFRVLCRGCHATAHQLWEAASD